MGKWSTTFNFDAKKLIIVHLGFIGITDIEVLGEAL